MEALWDARSLPSAAAVAEYESLLDRDRWVGQMPLNTDGRTTTAGLPIGGVSPSGMVILLVIVLGFGLRAAYLGHQSFWTDEILTVDAASVRFRDLFTRPRDYNLMPLYYAIMHGMLQVSRQEAWLRLPSALAGGVSIALFYQTLRFWFGDGVALKGAFLLAISPLHVWYSQEARAYTLVLLLCLGSVAALQGLERSPGSWSRRLLLVLVTAGALHAHFIALGFVVLVLVRLLISPMPASRVERLLLCGAIVVLCLPAVSRLALLLTSAGHSGGAAQQGTALAQGLAYLAWTFTTGFSLGPTLTELHSPDATRVAIHWLPLAVPVLGLVSAAVGVGVWRLWRERRDLFVFILLWALIPAAVAALAAVRTPYRFHVRYCLVAIPPFLLVLAIALDRSRRVLARSALLAFSVVAALSLCNYFFDPRYQREDNRAAGRFLASHALHGDLVLAGSFTGTDLEYYLADARGIQVLRYPPVGGLDPAGVDKTLSALLGRQSRFWLYQSRTFDHDPEGRILASCDARYRRDLRVSWGNVALIRYLPPNAGG